MMRLRMRTVSGWAALTGLVATAAFLAVSEAAAVVVSRGTSPLLAVGGFVIDIVPQPLKEFAIATFGEADKLVLLLSLGVAVVVAAAIVGIVQAVRPPWGVALFAVAAALATAAVVTRTGAGFLAGLAPLLGAAAGILVLVILSRRLRRWKEQAAADTVPPAVDDGTARLDRRGFFVLTAVVAASAVVVGLGARALNATTASIRQIRDALRLPAPRTTVSVPAGAELDVPGISPLFTPNADFYRVDTALTVPTVDPGTWRLVVDGMVDQRVELSFDDLLAMGLDEYAITLTCVSNEVGGDLVGTAVWQGVPVREVLKLAGVQSGADMVLSSSVDGFTASTPLSSLTDDGTDAILAVAMNGEPLPLEHGFPVRMVVPGLYGYVSATKWLSGLKVTTFAADEAYWTPRGYSAQAPIKFSSRVDTPKLGAPIAAGRVPIAGVAWAQTVGIERVEVSIDNGEWQQATLSAPVNEDMWVQWMLEWDAEPGSHYIAVRAINKAGETQIEQAAPIAPDGSSGWQRTLVSVS